MFVGIHYKYKSCTATKTAIYIAVWLLLFAFVAVSGCMPEDTPPPVIGPGVLPCYELVVLPPLPGDVLSRAHALNGATPVEVVGYSRSAGHVKRAVKWTFDENGVTRTVLPPLAGYGDAVANDVNDNGDACGVCAEIGTENRRPVLWTGGQEQDIYDLGQRDLGERAEATTISNAGLVAGFYVLTPPGEDRSTARPFSYSNNLINDFQNQLSTYSIIRAVDKAFSDLAVGNRETEGPNPRQSAFSIRPVAGTEYLPHLAYPPTDAYGIALTDNGRVLVAGTSVAPPRSSGPRRPVGWDGRRR